MLGPEMGNYVLATTTESDESGPKQPGAINGDFYARKSDWPAQYPSLVQTLASPLRRQGKWC